MFYIGIAQRGIFQELSNLSPFPSLGNIITHRGISANVVILCVLAAVYTQEENRRITLVNVELPLSIATLWRLIRVTNPDDYPFNNSIVLFAKARLYSRDSRKAYEESPIISQW